MKQIGFRQEKCCPCPRCYDGWTFHTHWFDWFGHSRCVSVFAKKNVALVPDVMMDGLSTGTDLIDLGTLDVYADRATSSRWLQVPWRQIGTRPSATAMLKQPRIYTVLSCCATQISCCQVATIKQCPRKVRSCSTLSVVSSIVFVIFFVRLCGVSFLTMPTNSETTSGVTPEKRDYNIYRSIHSSCSCSTLMYNLVTYMCVLITVSLVV